MSPPLGELRNHAQSVWLDSLSRDLIQHGHLARRIDEDGLRGITSNRAGDASLDEGRIGFLSPMPAVSVGTYSRREEPCR